MLNTIAAVIVDRQAQARQNDADFMRLVQVEEVKESYNFLERLFEKLNSKEKGVMELEELMDFYDAEESFREIMNRMDIHKQELPVVFNIIDRDDSGEINFTEFVSGLHAMKHDDPHTLMVFAKHFSERMYERWTDIDYIKTMLEDLQVLTDRARADSWNSETAGKSPQNKNDGQGRQSLQENYGKG